MSTLLDRALAAVAGHVLGGRDQKDTPERIERTFSGQIGQRASEGYEGHGLPARQPGSVSSSNEIHRGGHRAARMNSFGVPD